MKISAFFPAYNEEANVGALALKTSKVLAGICEDYEVIIVNDCSKDKTKEAAEEVIKQDSHIKLINHEKNKGYGGAVKSGLYASKFEWVFFTDGDAQFDVAEIPLLVNMTDKYDFINGYRIKRQDPFNRKLNAFMWGLLVKTLLGFWVKDVDCAFKLFRKEIIDNAQPEAEGAMISTELLAKTKKLGYKIGQIGVHHYPRVAGTQTGAKPGVILKAFKELIRLYGKIQKVKKIKN
ncbi:MAG: glycosyltransferase family 2 protein [Candidatus Goldiibacteriota bacterium HGW-Goldbacteria-1]|nr:MAG: glycosyltransferase family 2 protein [Candidatus Goldiibacteriota bacterium HGW-Goldbacteria-1]